MTSSMSAVNAWPMCSAPVTFGGGWTMTKVTGALHIGHAFTADIEDVMVRHARMQGRPTLWLPGLDHASIAAQVVLDKILAKEGETRQSLGRDRYLERMWSFVEPTRDTILRQSRRFGSSLDWSRARFTMDEVSSK